MSKTIYYATVFSGISGDFADEARIEIIPENDYWVVSVTGIRSENHNKPFLIGAAGNKNRYSSLDMAKQDMEKYYGKLDWYEKVL